MNTSRDDNGGKPHAGPAQALAALESMAQRLMLADSADSGLIGWLEPALDALAGMLDDADHPAIAALHALSARARDTDTPAKIARLVDLTSRSLALLQSSLTSRHPVKARDFPPELGLGEGQDIPGDDVAEAIKVNPDLYAVFLAAQPPTLAQIRSSMAEFTAESAGDVFHLLHAAFHKIKGDAGMVGAHDIHELAKEGEARCEEAGDKGLVEMPARIVELAAELDGMIVAACENNGIVMAPAPGSTEEDLHADTTESDLLLLNPIELEDPALARDFINEAMEHLENADAYMLVLEKDPENEDALNSVFRCFHTIKGISGFLKLAPVTELAHGTEALLDAVRKHDLTLTPRAVEVTFHSLDMLKTVTADMETAIARDSSFRARKKLLQVIKEVRAYMATPDKPTGEVQATEQRPQIPSITDASDGDEKHTEPDDDEADGRTTQPAHVAGHQTMKIDAEKIDLLLDTIGELVIAESVVAQDPEIARLGSQRISKNVTHLTKITRSLQDMGMAMRMIPIGPLFKRMARLVRDLARACGKKVELVSHGDDTELDRAMVEALTDPLVHMVRNAVDHGIEGTEAERIIGGKPAEATVHLRAYHKGGTIIVEVEDDGRGMDRDALMKKAISLGIARTGEQYTEQEIFEFIMEPGFSLAKKVTEISGRGVGMDVVRKNIESIRGRVHIESQRGIGTRFVLTLPLTTTIIDGMLIKVGVHTYVLPLLSIIESLRPTQDMLSTILGASETICFRESVIPLIRLSRLFEIPEARQSPLEGIVVVIEDAGKRAGILVDDLIGQQQTVIKNVPGMWKVEGIAGASILADGSPGLILDVGGIVRLANSLQRRLEFAMMDRQEVKA